jgi:hypothetical protein
MYFYVWSYVYQLSNVILAVTRPFDVHSPEVGSR